MPPKSSSKKTAAAASWYHCEQCDVHITAKARETHEKICPIEAINAAENGAKGLEYIANGGIYTNSIERKTFANDELADMPTKYVNQLIFISEGAMRLARLHIGQNVAVQTVGGDGDDVDRAPLIRGIWPLPEKFLTTVFVMPEDFELNWQQFKGAALRIEALSSSALTPAKTVQLKIENETATDQFTEQQRRDIKRILKQEIKNLIYTKNSKIHFNFFNKMLDLSISSWCALKEVAEAEGTEQEQQLTNALEQLQLNGTRSYLRIVATTQIELEAAIQLGDTDKETTVDIEQIVSKEDIGGLDEQWQIIQETMQIALKLRAVPKGVKVSRGLLLYGSTGCGKTLLCEALASSVHNVANVVRINSSELFSRFLGETEKNLAASFEQAFSAYPKPTLIIVEDVHNLCAKNEGNETAKRAAVAFLSQLDALSNKREAQRTFLLATTANLEALHASIRRCGRLDTELELGAPSPNARAQILSCLLCKLKHNVTPDEVLELAQATHGFVGADLSNLIYSSALAALKSADNLTVQHLRNALTHVKPSAMREVLIECPNVRWSDIGGQQELKLKLQQAIEWPLLHADKFKRLGIKPPRGLLMFGPPGCSKTMIAKALATESQLNFLSIKGPELFSMWVGESERAVREVFRKARQVAPSIVFFDEIDAISSERSDGGGGGSGSSVKERVLTQLLTEMDGVQSLQNVTIVAATNRPDMIDKALLRPGRIDRIVYVGLPDAAARREIFRIKLAQMPLADDVDTEQLVESTEGYSGAEIQAVCHEAALKTLEESFEAVEVGFEQFEYAFSAVRPRTSPELLRIYDEYIKKS